jgi:hypothetical protein
MLGIRCSLVGEVLQALLVMCVHDTRAQPSEDAYKSLSASAKMRIQRVSATLTSSGIATTITQSVAPFSSFGVHWQVLRIPVSSTARNDSHALGCLGLMSMGTLLMISREVALQASSVKFLPCGWAEIRTWGCWTKAPGCGGWPT